MAEMMWDIRRTVEVFNTIPKRDDKDWEAGFDWKSKEDDKAPSATLRVKVRSGYIDIFFRYVNEKAGIDLLDINMSSRRMRDATETLIRIIDALSEIEKEVLKK